MNGRQLGNGIAFIRVSTSGQAPASVVATVKKSTMLKKAKFMDKRFFVPRGIYIVETRGRGDIMAMNKDH